MSSGVFEAPVEVAGFVALEAADDLTSGASLLGASVGVCAGAVVVADVAVTAPTSATKRGHRRLHHATALHPVVLGA